MPTPLPPKDNIVSTTTTNSTVRSALGSIYDYLNSLGTDSANKGDILRTAKSWDMGTLANVGVKFERSTTDPRGVGLKITLVDTAGNSFSSENPLFSTLTKNSNGVYAPRLYSSSSSTLTFQLLDGSDYGILQNYDRRLYVYLGITTAGNVSVVVGCTDYGDYVSRSVVANATSSVNRLALYTDGAISTMALRKIGGFYFSSKTTSTATWRSPDDLWYASNSTVPWQNISQTPIRSGKYTFTMTFSSTTQPGQQTVTLGKGVPNESAPNRFNGLCTNRAFYTNGSGSQVGVHIYTWLDNIDDFGSEFRINYEVATPSSVWTGATLTVYYVLIPNR